MVQSIFRPLDDGRVRLPPVDSAMNKRPGRLGRFDDKGTVALRIGKDQTEKEKLLDRARKRMDRAINSESENRKAALDDRMFWSGDQWPKEIMAQRNLDKRPCLTINKLKVFTSQVVNAQRENRPSININPVGDRSDPEVARMFRGLIRFIERDCAADIAYDSAFFDTVVGGYGYWRILTEYEAPDSFNQVLVIRRIRNPFTVYLDPDHQDPTGADAQWGFITQFMERSEFEAKYPDCDMTPYQEGGIGEKFTSWVAKDSIRVAEYFEIEHEKRTLVRLSNDHVGWQDALDDITKGNLKRGRLEIIEEREVRVPEVKWYKLTALDILKEEDWLGSTIPIVKVVGHEVDIEGKVKYSGLIRDSKDPQRMFNYWRELSIDTRLPTPSGWTTMGNVEAGEYLLDEHGRPVKVLGKSPVYLRKDCYRIRFDDGSSIISSGEHEWPVEERGKRKASTWDWTTKPVLTHNLTPGKHFIWATKPLDLPEADLLISPYLLGLWLGDGSTNSPQLCPGDEDLDEIRSLLSADGHQLGQNRKYGDKTTVFTVHDLVWRLRQLGLLANKHVPAIYLRASFEQRLALLQGFMDSDGSIARSNRQCSYTTITPSIARGFAELVRTLGLKAVKCRRAARRMVMPGGYESDCQEATQFSFTAPYEFPVSRLERKLLVQRQPAVQHSRRTKRHRILAVEPVPSVPVQCLAVDSPTHLFLAGDGMVPTHNTAETELIALQPKAPWVVEEGQIEGHEDEWKNSNVKNQPYLSYKGTSVSGTMAPPPQRQPMAGVPAGIEAAIAGAAQDMMATTGIRFDATMNERMIDESGKAIRELRRSGDLGSFHYVDNLARSLKRTGEILVEVAPFIYDEPRVVTILREDDKEEQVKIDPTLNKPTGEEKRQDGKVRKLFNPMFGKYGVTVTIGPSYATKRIEAAESMMAFMKALPQTASLVADLFAKASDWPGAEEIAIRLAKTIPPQLLQPDMKDVPPQVQAIIAGLEQSVHQLTQQLQGAMAALQDKDKDRAIKIDDINKRFESSILKIVSDTETKMAKIQEQATANFNTHLTAQMKELGGAVKTLEKSLEEPEQPESVYEGPPPEAIQHLREGRATRFQNGEVWTMKDGVPTKVAA